MIEIMDQNIMNLIILILEKFLGKFENVYMNLDEIEI